MLLPLRQGYDTPVKAIQPGSVDLTEVLSMLTARRVRIGEIIAALKVGRSTYYEQRDEGRLVSADNLLRLAAEMNLNPVELLLHCGLISRQAVAEYLGSITKADLPRQIFVTTFDKCFAEALEKSCQSTGDRHMIRISLERFVPGQQVRPRIHQIGRDRAQENPA